MGLSFEPSAGHGRELVKTTGVGIGKLLVWIFLFTSLFAQSMPSGDRGGGTNNYDSPSYADSDYGTNLWLSINLSNDAVHLLLHNTQPGVPYWIQSREDLTSGSWFYEETVTGAVAVTVTPATLNAGARTNSLFIQALTWMTNPTGGTPVMLAMGGERIMEVTTNGDVVSWGRNHYGEFGDYTHLDSESPVHVVGLAKIIKIAAGLNHSLALDATGTLLAWGQNNVGQLGVGDGGYEASTNLPVPVTGMTNIIAMTAHGYIAGSDGPFGFSMAVKVDGTVWMWGSADGYWFGDSPVQITGISNVVAVAAGAVHALALETDGTVWAWGMNYFSQLGDGSKNDSDIPVQVMGLSNIVAVCAGDDHSLALDANGNIWAWGLNYYGQLGNGGAEWYDDVPVRVSGLTNMVAIAAGANHSLALDGGGQLWAWGDDEYEQLGDGGVAYGANLPMQVVGLTNIISIAAGTEASVAVDANGNLWQWGQGNDWPYQEWGDENGYPRLSPTSVDFYNGQLPNLEILSGNNQLRHAGSEFEQPLVFRVADANGVALSNAPVSVEVVAGDMELRTASGGDNYKGLRLTTDANGEMSLIGYADGYVNNPDCRIRVLAASRERVREADFSETIVPQPTISITAPADGGTYLVGSDQPLTISVDAQAAPGASVQEVDYSCEINGEEMPLGVSTQSPFSFIWTNTLWWTNAFVGQYILSAVALDNAGGWSDAQSATITVALDSDGNGMPDYWQLQCFGELGIDANADPDGDGINNLQEYQNGSSPMDYYNGNLPYLEILGGNDQAGNYDSFLPKPVTIKVAGTSEFANSSTLINAPIVFTVTTGTALLAVTTNDTPVTSLALRTDSNGQVSAWVYFPPAGSNPPDSTIVASAASGTNSTTVIVNEFVPMGRWRFDDTNTWVGEGGQLPLLAANVVGISSWSSNAVLVDCGNPALLAYNVMESNDSTNINCQAGSVLFWFKSDWSSASAGGNGPGAWGRLIEVGSYDPAFTNGWWSLYLSPDGTQLLFGTSTNGDGMTNLSANIMWHSNEWHQIALTYSPTGSALYVDGQLLADGSGVAYFPDADELTNGFRIGSDQDGNNQAEGAFDELETFNYPLAAANTATYSGEIPDWWEVKYFGHAGLDPNFSPAGDGFTLLFDYERGNDPNVIQFNLEFPSSYVNTNVVTGYNSIISGEPAYMAVLVNDTNQADAVWQAYSPNVTVNLDAGDGDYNVMVGLRGLPLDAAQTWLEATLTLDPVPPVLEVTSPVSGTVSQPLIQLQGWASKTLRRLTFDVSNVTGVFTNQICSVTDEFYDTNVMKFTTNYFQCYDVRLTNGANLITLHALDLAGNTATTTISYTLDYSGDTTPPVLCLVWPQDGTQISGSNFTLQAQVDDDTAAITALIVDSNGDTNIVQGLVESSGAVWVNNLPLANGTNWLTLTAKDAAGNTSTTNLNVIDNDVGLVINPLASGQLNQSSVTVTGSINNSNDIVAVNGVAAEVNSDGTWEADNVPVDPTGTVGLNVQAGDNSGNPLAAQSVYQAQPVTVKMVSYSGYHHMYAGSSDDEDNSVWTHQSGGFDVGHSISPGSWIPFQPPVNYAWHINLAAGFDPAFEFAGVPGIVRMPEEASASSCPDGQNDVDKTRTRFMIVPSGRAAAGTMATYLVQARVWCFSDPYWAPTLTLPYAQLLPASAINIQGMPLVDNGSGMSEMILQAPANANVDVTPVAAGNYIFNVQVANIALAMAVDNNRDGQINLDDSDATTPAKPFRFWINDSLEHGDDESAVGADDQIPGQPSVTVGADGIEIPYANYAKGQIQGRSDLVNFFPVVLCLSNALQLLPPASGYEYHLVQDDGAVKFVYTSLMPTNAFDYLTNTASAGYGANFIEWSSYADTIQAATAPGAVLDNNWLANVQANGGMGVILAEGSAASTRPLWLEIWRDGKLLTGVPLYLSISGVEQMFRHVNFCYVDGTVTVPARADAPNEPPTNDKNLVFLHGYNVNQQQARGVESEMFKRFYWSGSKAKFYGVTWNGAESKDDVVIQALPQSDRFTPNFHTNVVNALQTAPHLASFLNGLSGETTVAAHSLGNMVVLSAISDFNVTAIKHYFMIDSAVPIEAVQGDAAKEPAMIYSTWRDYSNRLYAADWWQLFTNDYRSALTWSNRLGNLGKVDIYNFYSSGEEVLREDLDDPPSTVIGSVLQEAINAIGFWGGAGLPFGTYAWAWQEKGKGTDTSDAFIGSTHGGWKFSYYWVDSFGDPLSPSIMNDSQNSILQYQPMFSFASSPNGPPDEDLLRTDGSTYAQANRDRILSDAIPALTLPVGANHVDKFAPQNADDKNFNMQTSFETGWPVARSNPADDEAYKWHHSDFDYVAYPFTYKLFNQIVTSGNLK